MIQQFFSHQFLMFLLTGGTAAVVNLGSRFVFDLWFSFSNAIILGYLCGMITAFVLAKLFVFKTSAHNLTQSGLYFCLVNLIAIFQTWLISMLLAFYLLPQLGISQYVPEIAHFVGVVVPVFTSYLGHKHWSFK